MILYSALFGEEHEPGGSWLAFSIFSILHCEQSEAISVLLYSVLLNYQL